MTVSYLDFTEERLELGYDYGCVGGPSFSTEIVSTGASVEQRNARTWQPKGRWQLGSRTLLDSDYDSIKEVEYLRQFHAARKGSKQGFRFKDWSDYRATDVQIGITDGSTKQFQLVKVYSVGSEYHVRPILKPVAGTVEVYIDGGKITIFSVDSETGIVTLNSTFSSGRTITADFEFDVPVRFEADKIEWTLSAIQLQNGDTLHQLGSVFVREMRLPVNAPYSHFVPIPQVISQPLNLGVILNTTETITFDTRSESLVSGYSSDSSNDSFRKVIKLPTFRFNQQQLDTILNYFWVAKGRLSKFEILLNDTSASVRFNSDSLSIKFVASEGIDSLYDVSLEFMYQGILAQTQGRVIVLDLTGLDFVDRSQFSHPVTNNGVVLDASNNSYQFDGSSDLQIPDNETWHFDNYDFSISFDLLVTPNSFVTPLIAQTDNGRSRTDRTFAIYLRRGRDLYFESTNGIFATALPDLNYRTTFQNIKIEKTNNFLYFYYNNILLRDHLFAQPIPDKNLDLSIGKYGAYNLIGNLKNIKITKF